MGEPANKSENKENSLINIRSQIDAWRGQRFEKLNSRLLRCRQSCSGNSCIVSPSILGVTCPKNLRERMPPTNEGPKTRGELCDLRLNSNNLKTGLKQAPLARKALERPPVRQTITSRLRMIKSNPFMEGGKYYDFRPNMLNGNRGSEMLSSADNHAAVCSTPAIGKNEQLEFSNCISAIKSKSSPNNFNNQTFLKYE